MTVKLDDLTARLRSTFEGDLPGVEAQLRMCPRPRPGWTPDHAPDDARVGAGLILIYPAADLPHLVLTVRHADLAQHAGQVSLPGGAREEGEDRTAAALREAREEVAIDPDRVEILGELTRLHIPVSGFVLHPVVGWTPRRPDFHPDEREVDRILEIPVRTLCDPATIQIQRREREGVTYDVPFFAVDGEKVWGATAMVLAELLWILGHPPAPFE